MKTMKPLALALVLTVLSGGVLAEWIEIQKFEDGMRVFVDKTTARRNGDTAQVLHLVRWAEPQVDEGLPPYLSTVVRTTYDCVAKREKYMASTSYAGPMGGGAKVIADEDEAEIWYSISEASMEDKLWKIACAAK
jgi:hypothetical protein